MKAESKSKKKTASEKQTENPKEAETAFSKQQILLSEKFKDRRDALSVCLKDNKKYTLEQAEKALEKFMKGQV